MGAIISSSRKMDCNLFFSEFCKTFENNSGQRALSMHRLIHLWYKNCLTKEKWQSLVPHFRNRVMQDFIDTLYCASNSFDEIFLILYVNATSRCFILGQNKQVGLSFEHLAVLAEDILKFASLARLQYTHLENDQKFLENLVDFPLKNVSLCCSCARRPLYVAIRLGSPDMVRLLLNCGARIPYEDVCPCFPYQRHPLENVMDGMSAPSETSFLAKSLQSMASHSERYAMALRVLLGDLSYLNPLWNKVCKALEDVTGQENDDYIPSLKHLSRFKIRCVMKQRGSFYEEHLVQKLGLPAVLMNYLKIDEQMNPENEIYSLL